MRDTIRLLLDGTELDIASPPPTQTLLQYLRETLGHTACKEGCAEGDCGACSVVLAERAGAGLRWRAINACIALLPSLDGKAVYTAAGLAAADGRLHPVQQAMVETHASQCGFCTPGFVMSLFALFKSAGTPDRADIDRALAGNLCRCTGYRPIIDAALRMHALADANDPHGLARPGPAAAGDFETALLAQLDAIAPQQPLAYTHAGQHFCAPLTLSAACHALAAAPEATLLAGGTDIGLWLTKALRQLPALIYLGRVAELQALASDEHALLIGAAVPLSDAWAALLGEYPELTEIAERFASPPIRNAGTLGGNLANGSPIGDGLPVLIALGAQIELVSRRGARWLALEDYYLGYRRQARQADELLARIRVPRRQPGQQLAAYKVAKRYDQDIAAVCAAFSLQLDAAGSIAEARVACGGMAATVHRARGCEAALRGRRWEAQTLAAACTALATDYTPLDDLRASAAYRQRVAANLLRRFFSETTAPAIATRAVAGGCR